MYITTLAQNIEDNEKYVWEYCNNYNNFIQKVAYT